jgi:hypothetical protein
VKHQVYKAKTKKAIRSNDKRNVNIMEYLPPLRLSPSLPLRIHHRKASKILSTVLSIYVATRSSLTVEARNGERLIDGEGHVTGYHVNLS